MPFETIRLEKSENLATISLNRPDSMNSFNLLMLNELAAALEEVAVDEDILAVIVTGEGRAFSAGADIKAKDDMFALPQVRQESQDILRLVVRITLAIRQMPKPVIAAVNGVAAGAFRLAIDSTHTGIRFIEGMAYLRSRYLRLPYGDQALFMKKALFEEIGGFPEMPIMEDFILVRRLKRRGKIVIVPESVKTSARRWLHLGIFEAWLINQLIVTAYYLRISPNRLSRWYRREMGKTGN